MAAPRAHSHWRWEYKEKEEILREIKKMHEKDYYYILGLQSYCSSDDVKKAYLKLSLKVHPDKNKSPDADHVFKMISEAYQRLKEVTVVAAASESSSRSSAPQPNRGRAWETSGFAGGMKRPPAAAGNSGAKSYHRAPETRCHSCGKKINVRGYCCADSLFKYKPSKNVVA